MPNPKTIEELLKMKPCPFDDGEEITETKLSYFLTNIPHVHSLVKAVSDAFENNQPFKMPEGYYYLPIGMELGLPLGYYSSNKLLPLIDSLPLSVIKEYCWRPDIACTSTRNDIQLEDFGSYFKWFTIKKQPPNLYNPLDHKEEVLMENNSANEELRYQLKCPPKFTPFNPNFFERKFTLDELKALNFQPASCGIMPMSKIDEITNYIGVCFSDQTWGLSEEGITYLNDQITQIIHDHHQPEAEPVKEQPTPTELPWQDISTLKGSGYKGDILIRWDSSSIHYHSNTWKYDIIESYQNEKALSPFSYITHWLPITPPKAPTVEVPVEPERVSVQEFANSGYVTQKQGFWVNSGHGYFKLVKDVSRVGGVEDYNIYVLTVIAEGHPIYATDPSAWLAWKAEQEGKSV